MKINYQTLRNIAPNRLVANMPPFVRDYLSGETKYRKLPSYKYLEKAMSFYTVSNLKNVSPEVFKRKIIGFLSKEDYVVEGYKSPRKQRDLSVKFHWGHNHDFGDFYLEGKMANNHLNLIATFIDVFKSLPVSLKGKRVLDIGCWTGGTSLLLCKMGAAVTAIEEVRKYVDCLKYLKKAFGIKNLTPLNKSLYECTTEKFQDKFDFVLFAGVLYHVTDPVLALRTTFNSLKMNGKCLLETASINTKENILEYYGPTITRGGEKKKRNRGGWNWLLPSPSTLNQMLQDVGYAKDIKMKMFPRSRLYAVATKKKDTDMLRAGLSRKSIK